MPEVETCSSCKLEIDTDKEKFVVKTLPRSLVLIQESLFHAEFCTSTVSEKKKTVSENQNQDKNLQLATTIDVTRRPARLYSVARRRNICLPEAACLPVWTATDGTAESASPASCVRTLTGLAPLSASRRRRHAALPYRYESVRSLKLMCC